MEENIEQETEITNKKEELVFSEQIKSNLLTYAKWGKFLGIVTYIGAGLMVALGFIFLFVSPLTSNIPGIGGVVYGISMFILLIIYGVLYAIIAYLLFKSSKETKIGIETNNQEAIEKGTDKLGKLFTFFGIMTIIVLCIYALVIFIAGISFAFIAPLIK
jgi:TRAP-type C4-dicarboxylate transport system permease small subunit